MRNIFGNECCIFFSAVFLWMVMSSVSFSAINNKTTYLLMKEELQLAYEYYFFEMILE